MPNPSDADRTLLVTGGAGFIGSAFVRRAVLKHGWKVITFDALTYAGDMESLAAVMHRPRHQFIHGDVRDDSLVTSILTEHTPDQVVHFAAQTHVDRSIDSPEIFVQTNVVGTERLLRASLRYWQGLRGSKAEKFRLVNVSTDEVYGSLGPAGAFTEQSPYAPNSPYAASKAAGDHLVRAYARTYGLPAITTHCTNNYGPFQFPEKLIPLSIIKTLRGQAVGLYGDGEQVRDWLAVEDHCRALEAVLEHGDPGEAYNISSGDELANVVLVTQLLKLLDELHPAPWGGSYVELIRFVPDRPGHDRRYALDSGKARRQLDWAPRVAWTDGLRHTVQWYLDNLQWVNKVTSQRYGLERLGTGLALQTHMEETPAKLDER
jgi:dTDP-glucose 4,6-dehydratase